MTLKQWADQWKVTSKKLDEIRFENIQNTNTSEGILAFNGLFTQTILDSLPKSTSGLVEQQSLFKKLRSTKCKI